MSKKYLPRLLLSLSLFLCVYQTMASGLQNNKSILSDTPAGSWEDAMLTGNGLIGVMQYGDPLAEKFIFNCHKFLLPNGAPFVIPDMSDMVEPMRDLMINGKIGDGWVLYHRELLKRQGIDISNNKSPYAGMLWSQSYHPGYVMNLDMTADGKISNYNRVIDYQTGEITVRWTDNRGDWVRKSFASRKDNVIVTKLISPPSCTISCSLSTAPAIKSSKSVHYQTIVNQDFINVRAKYPEVNSKQGGYEGVTKVITRQGKKIVDGETLRIEGAREVLLLTKLDRYKDDFNLWDAKLLQIDLQATIRSYEKLLCRHVTIHKELFNRVDFTLFGDKEGLSLSTEKLLEREASDKTSVDKALLEKLFYTSRYLFISSCGAQYGPRLTGMFIGAWGAAWAGDYTCDANVNLAILGGGIANLPECMEGYFQVIERSLPQWREAARQFYGCRGILGPVRIDGEVGIPLHVASYHAHCTATGLGPWLLYPMYEHYKITGDKEFLRKRLYPLLKQQAWFYEDFLTRTDENGNYIFVPSNSPENAWKGVQPRTSASVNATMDIAACKHAFRMLFDAEKELGIAEGQESRKWKEILAKIPPYLINKDGALQEWSWPGHGENYGHRHSSHMYVVWPAYEINPESRESAHLMPAVRTALDMRRAKVIHAHDALMKSISRIRVKQADELYDNLKFFMENKYFYTSLASSHDLDHHIYNYDLILTLQGLLIEMAVFTNDDVVELLPALSEAFFSGQLKGVKGRNQTTIESLRWNMDSHQISCRITSDIDQTITLVHRKGIKRITCDSEVTISSVGDFAREIKLSAGKPTEIAITF